MGNIFYLAGIALAGYSGYHSNGIVFIFISAALFSIGYMIARFPASMKLHTFPVTMITNSIVTAGIYFIAQLFQ